MINLVYFYIPRTKVRLCKGSFSHEIKDIKDLEEMPKRMLRQLAKDKLVTYCSVIYFLLLMRSNLIYNNHDQCNNLKYVLYISFLPR